MAGLTLSLADAVLKDDYKGPLRKQINDSVKLLAQVEKNTEDITGRRAILPCHMTRNTGVGARLEGAVLPAAGNQGTIEQIVNVRYNYGKVRLTKQTITRMASDRGAFIRATKLEMDGLHSDCARDVGRQVWGTSNAVLATCGTTSASNTVQLAATTPEQVMVSFAEGLRVDIGTAGVNSVSVAADRAVSSVNITNKTFVIDGAAVTTTSAHSVFRQGTGAITGSTGQRELTGVQSIVSDTGTLFSIDPTAYFQWQSIVEANGGVNRPVSENLVEKAAHRAENRSGSSVSSLWAEDGVYRAAANLLQAQKRIVNTQDLKGGHKGLEFNYGGEGAPLVRDRDCPPNKIYGLSHKDLVEYVDEDWTWEDEDGSVLQRSTDSTHTFEAIFFKFHEFATTRRNAHFRIDDIEAA